MLKTKDFPYIHGFESMSTQLLVTASTRKALASDDNVYVPAYGNVGARGSVVG
jgi:hypothetical protein